MTAEKECIMLILGIIGYTILCLLALTWIVGVRTQLACGLHTIIGSLFFSVSAIAIPAFGVNFLHAWWAIPAGYCISMLSVRAIDTPLFGPTMRAIGSLYAEFVRIGIDPKRIQAVQTAETWLLVEKCLDEQQ